MATNVSIVIPVYNAEKYLAECIESLLGQTLAGCEYIFVNDGSSDGSLALIEKYQREHPCIRLINQSNQGVSAARNAGIAAAVGEYIGFVDADDWVKSDMCEVMYNAAEQSQCDVVLANYESTIDGKPFIATFGFPSFCLLDRDYLRDEVLVLFLKGWTMNSVFNKLFRTSLLRRHDIVFRKGLAFGEDRAFVMEYFAIASSMVYADKIVYYYREVSGSASRNLEKSDYFNHALLMYEMDFPEGYANLLPPAEVSRIKSIELISAIMSYIHVYLKPDNGLSFWRKYHAIRHVLRHPAVRFSLPIYISEPKKRSRYERWFTRFMELRSVLGLFCAAYFIKLRNHASIGG